MEEKKRRNSPEQSDDSIEIMSEKVILDDMNSDTDNDIPRLDYEKGYRSMSEAVLTGI